MDETILTPAEKMERVVERLTRERDEARAEAQDHHFHSRGLPVRMPDEIREHINSDHPCCIGVGDACALLAEVARLEGLILDAFEFARIKPGSPNDAWLALLSEVERIRAQRKEGR